ncbi:hypothetical protein [Lonsdalea iberica]|uniref:hypothetical protein n=1 Tax=Lonsdalea iberica TaxID=1082703 RepID=UPI0020CB01DF|nr:hypothetical protein [Lonsdalea iberica]
MRKDIEAERKRIEREYIRLEKCFSDFTHLKQRMLGLIADSEKDPEAARKLMALQQLFPEGLGGIENNARQDMKALNTTLKQLQSKFKNIVSVH